MPPEPASPNRDFIRVGKSPIAGTGVFAKRKIPRGTRIIEYTGEHVPIKELRISTYALVLNPTTVIDGARNGNAARFCNHSCDPNCEAYIFDGHAYIYAMRDIVRGEELTFDYHLAPADRATRRWYDKTSYLCTCGAANCRGTLITPGRGQSAAG